MFDLRSITIKVPQNVLICSAIAISFFASNPGNAADFTVGNVKKTFPTDALCQSFNANMPNNPILVSLNKSAWININGKDIELKYINHKNVNNKRTISKFQGKGFTVTIDSTFIRVNNGALETSDYREVITIKRGDTSKVLQTNGRC